MLSVRGGFPWARTASDAEGPFWALAAGEKRTNKLAASVSAMARSKKRKRSERGIDGSPFIGGRAPCAGPMIPLCFLNVNPKECGRCGKLTFGLFARILETRATP